MRDGPLVPDFECKVTGSLYLRRRTPERVFARRHSGVVIALMRGDNTPHNCRICADCQPGTAAVQPAQSGGDARGSN